MSDNSTKTDLTVLIPLYNERDNLKPLFEKIESVLEGLTSDWEVVFVDDGSTDGSFEVLEELRAASPRVKLIRFGRNFGKSAALDAGFQLARGGRIVIMDADLQDDPAEVPALLEKLDEGFDLVSGWRVDRRDRPVKRYTSRVFNRVTSTLTGIKLHDFNCGLKAFRREVIRSVPLHGELHRYIPVLAYWKGFRVTEVKVRHHPRVSGESKFGIYRFFAGLMDMITVMFLTKYSKKPLHLFGGVGLIVFFMGFLINAYLFGIYILGYGFRVRPLLFLGVLLMMIGFQLISTGLLGEMMAISLHRGKEENITRKIFD